MIEKLKDKIEQFPQLPGIYIMRDGENRVLYIGKAKSLKDRISQYMPPTSDNRFFIKRLIENIEDIEIIITTNEKEAFLLENELIKKLKPLYNIRLKDDKNYVSVRIDTDHPFPKIEIVRRQKKDGALYFGPFLSSSEIRHLIKILRTIFKIRICKDIEFNQRKRPCIQYQIERCSAPCVFKDESLSNSYREAINRCIRILSGKDREIISELKDEMKRLSDEMRFEEAAQLRDIINIIDRRMQAQSIINIEAPNMDIFGIASDSNHISLFILKFRDGRIFQEQAFLFENMFFDISELLQNIIVKLYLHADSLPSEIILPVDPGNITELQSLFSQNSQKIEINHIKSGFKHKLVELANQNASYRLHEFLQKKSILHRLRYKLNLKNIPEKIECYDISHISGEYTVGAKVVAKNGTIYKDEYRRYKIESDSAGDDYLAIYEVIKRRLSHTEEELPDLIMLDGGRGQISACQKAITEVKPKKEIEIIAIAKERGEKENRIFKAGSKNYIKLNDQSEESRLLILLRDEAHRFANDYRERLYKKENL